MTSAHPLAVIGLGAIGGGVAANLLSAGFPVTGCEPGDAARAAFESIGGRCAASPALAAAGCGVALICVFDESQAEQVLFDDDGVVGVLTPGSVVVMHTTMARTAVARMAERLSGTGITLVDAPVTGGKAGADAGTLTVITAGDGAALDRLEPIFEAYSARRYRVGETPGAATTVKMINQLMMGAHLAVTAEAMALARAAGADTDLVRQVITHGTGFSRAFESRAEAMLAGDYLPVRGALDIFVKDLGLVSDLAGEVGGRIPLAAAARERFAAASARGLGQLDCAALIEEFLPMPTEPTED